MTADILDQAAALTTAMADYTISNIRKAAQTDTSNPAGLCYWCQSKTDLTRRWCDSTCRDSWLRDEEA